MRPIFVKIFTVCAIVLWVCVSFAALDWVSSRHILPGWAMFCAIALPLVFWFDLSFRKWGISLLIVGFVIALSPIDITTTRTGRPGLQFRSVSYGYRCSPGTLCYGCVVPPIPARRAVVISY